MRKTLYLSTFLPRNQKDFLAGEMRNFNFNSADAFSYSIFSGLAEATDRNMMCVNVPPLGAYPRYNKLSRYAGGTYEDNGVSVKSIGYSTFYVYQYFSIYKNVLDELKKNVDTECYNIIIYSINVPVLKAAIKFRSKYSPDSKIILIVPDLLEFSFEETIASKIKTAIIGDMKMIYDVVDGFVFLTEDMNQRVKTEHPYCIVEGVYNQQEKRLAEKPHDGLKRIFYSGMLYEKFGVKTLVDAFMKTLDSSFRLQICGVGELEEYIQSASKKDPRIEFFGLVSREKVLAMQSEAMLLVNPRTPEGEFTKFSFPSKNIEYLVSGTPVLLYELDGIPSEYYDYCYHLSKNDLGCDKLRNKIEEILNQPEKSLIEQASRASNFIIEYKNSKTQAEKILALAELLN